MLRSSQSNILSIYETFVVHDRKRAVQCENKLMHKLANESSDHHLPGARCLHLGTKEQSMCIFMVGFLLEAHNLTAVLWLPNNVRL